jgi:hypothetical protein
MALAEGGMALVTKRKFMALVRCSEAKAHKKTKRRSGERRLASFACEA